MSSGTSIAPSPRDGIAGLVASEEVRGQSRMTGLRSTRHVRLRGIHLRVKDHPVAALFVLAFALTWLIEVPLVAGARGLLPLDPSSPLGSVTQLLNGPMPAIAALIIAALLAGRRDIKTLLSRLRSWREWRSTKNASASLAICTTNSDRRFRLSS